MIVSHTLIFIEYVKLQRSHSTVLCWIGISLLSLGGSVVSCNYWCIVLFLHIIQLKNNQPFWYNNIHHDVHVHESGHVAKH